MYCRYCGEMLPDDSVFCNKCGKPTNPPTDPSTGYGQVQTYEYTPSYSYHTPPLYTPPLPVGCGPVLGSMRYSLRTVSGLLISDFVDIVLGCLLLIFGKAINLNSYDAYSYEQIENVNKIKDFLETLGTICLISGAVGILITLLIAFLNSQFHCTAYENAVVGTFTGSRWSLTPIDLSLTYDQIESVECKKKTVIITSKGSTYYVTGSNTGEADSVFFAIRKKIVQYQNSKNKAAAPDGSHSGQSMVSESAAGVAATVKDGKKICPQCGFEQDANRKVCWKCGIRI